MKRKGFTLIELLITVIIAVIITAATFLDYSGKKQGADVTATTQQAGTLVREAQNRTMAGDQNGTTGAGFWGVQFSNATNTSPFYALLYATSTAGIASGTVIGRYSLPSTIAYTTSSIATGGTLYVYYSNGLTPGVPPGAHEICSGYTCPAGTSTIAIGLYAVYQTPILSSTISIVASGGVSY
jgi:prepilin-type N-terminal cleavage/methylation domain-containing protein